MLLKHFFSFCLILAFVAMSVIVVGADDIPDDPLYVDEGTFVCGDVDNDGSLDITDVTLLQRYIANMDLPLYCSYALSIVDVNRNLEVEITDCTFMQRCLVQAAVPPYVDAGKSFPFSYNRDSNSGVRSSARFDSGIVINGKALTGFFEYLREDVNDSRYAETDGVLLNDFLTYFDFDEFVRIDSDYVVPVKDKTLLPLYFYVQEQNDEILTECWSDSFEFRIQYDSDFNAYIFDETYVDNLKTKGYIPDFQANDTVICNDLCVGTCSLTYDTVFSVFSAAPLPSDFDLYDSSSIVTTIESTLFCDSSAAQAASGGIVLNCTTDRCVSMTGESCDYVVVENSYDCEEDSSFVLMPSYTISFNFLSYENVWQLFSSDSIMSAYDFSFMKSFDNELVFDSISVRMDA